MEMTWESWAFIYLAAGMSVFVFFWPRQIIGVLLWPLVIIAFIGVAVLIKRNPGFSDHPKFKKMIRGI